MGVLANEPKVGRRLKLLYESSESVHVREMRTGTIVRVDEDASDCTRLFVHTLNSVYTVQLLD